MMGRLQRWRCRRLGHDWFPDSHSREFIPLTAICLRCRDELPLLPTGQCLGGHPIAEHYDEHAEFVEHPTCPGPR